MKPIVSPPRRAPHRLSSPPSAAAVMEKISARSMMDGSICKTGLAA